MTPAQLDDIERTALHYGHMSEPADTLLLVEEVRRLWAELAVEREQHALWRGRYEGAKEVCRGCTQGARLVADSL